MTDLLTPSDAETAPAGDGRAASATTTTTGADDAPRRRAFRAATLDDAVAAARAELGPDVELLEANRVRRGGLGGFFATDLGVEIVAAPQSPAAGAATSTSETAPVPRPAPTPQLADVQPLPAMDPVLPVAPASAEVVTALDRLIQHAESIDRTIPIEHADRAPAPMMNDELDPLWLSDDERLRAADPDPDSFEAHLRSEMAAVAYRGSADDLTPPAVDRPPVIDPSDPTADLTRPSAAFDHSGIPASTVGLDEGDPTEEIDRTEEIELLDDDRLDAIEGEDVAADEQPRALAPEDAAADDRFEEVECEDDEPEDLDTGAAGDRASGSTTSLAPPSSLLNPALAGHELDVIEPIVDPVIEELDALLQELGISIESVDAPEVPTPITATSLTTIDTLARVAAERLLDGVAAIDEESAERIDRLSISVTAPDGTTVSVASDLHPRAQRAMIVAGATSVFDQEDCHG